MFSVLQEACAVGIRAVMEADDSIITAYRAHGIAYLMGVSPLGVLAELTGRQSGDFITYSLDLLSFYFIYFLKQ